MIIKKICILGGTGFVGQTLANRLARDGFELRILTRNRETCKNNLILIPNLELIETNVHNAEQLANQFDGCNAVINLVGILNEWSRNGEDFRKVHIELVKKIIDACRKNNIKRLLQMSALNANVNGASHYLRSKGEAEQLLHVASDINVTSYCPSVIFGQRDSFFNRFAGLLKLLPVFFPLACPKARFAPVFIGDVAEAMALTLQDPENYGKRLQLCGPDIFTLEELVRFTAKSIGKKKIIIPLPDILSRIQAQIFDFFSPILKLLSIEKPFSRDNYLSLKEDSICDRNDLELLGISATPIEAVVPKYLLHSNFRSRYYSYRKQSRRNI